MTLRDRVIRLLRDKQKSQEHLIAQAVEEAYTEGFKKGAENAALEIQGIISQEIQKCRTSKSSEVHKYGVRALEAVITRVRARSRS